MGESLIKMVNAGGKTPKMTYIAASGPNNIWKNLDTINKKYYLSVFCAYNNKVGTFQSGFITNGELSGGGYYENTLSQGLMNWFVLTITPTSIEISVDDYWWEDYNARPYLPVLFEIS